MFKELTSIVYDTAVPSPIRAVRLLSATQVSTAVQKSVTWDAVIAIACSDAVVATPNLSNVIVEVSLADP